MSEEQPGDATEQADYYEDDCHEALPPVMTSSDAATTVADATGKKQMFTKSLAHRDDWLHRGIMLRDMDYYHYSRYVERVEMPRSGSAQSFQKPWHLLPLRCALPACKDLCPNTAKASKDGAERRATMQAIRC